MVEQVLFIELVHVAEHLTIAVGGVGEAHLGLVGGIGVYAQFVAAAVAYAKRAGECADYVAGIVGCYADFIGRVAVAIGVVVADFYQQVV